MNLNVTFLPDLLQSTQRIVARNILCLILVWPCVGNAAQSGYFTYEVTQSTITVTKYVGPDGEVAVPGIIEGLPVTALGDRAFDLRNGVTSITLPDSVTRIGDVAFSYCGGLTSIAMGGSVASIGADAFRFCSGLRSVNLPNSLTNIGNYAFGWCGGLTNLTVPNGVTHISTSAFTGCDALASLTIDMATISGAFAELKNLKSVTFGDNVTTIGDRAFSGCTGLTNITLPDSLTSLGYGAFEGCTGLASITLPGSVTRIGDGAFSECTGLTKIILPSGVTSIGASAFRQCTGLTSIALPENLTRIGFGMLNGCARLTAISLPNGLTNIDDWAFSGCAMLRSIALPNGVSSIGDYAFSHCSGLTSLSLPNSVTGIGNGAFAWCGGLTSLSLPNSVTQIGKETFNGCARLASLILPNGLTNIGDQAFSGCAGLTNLTLPDSVTKVGHAAFEGCTALTSITLPNSLTSIGDWAFDGCRRLTSIVVPYSVTTIGPYAFFDCSGLTSLTLLNGVTSIEKGAFAGCTGLTNLTLPNSLTRIGDSAFQECGGLTSLTLPDSVTSLGDRAFGGCTGLANLTLPNSVSSLGDHAFAGCNGLVSVTIDTTTIGNAFSGCTGLASIILPDGLTTIADEGFSGCSTLTSITLPNSLTSIGGSAFSGCRKLTSITLPKSVTSIGIHAFFGCTGLNGITVDALNPNYSDSDGVLLNKEQTTLIQYPVARVGSYVLPNSVTHIVAEAFRGSKGLTSLTLPAGVASIGDLAFFSCNSLTSFYFEGNNPAPGPAVFGGPSKAIVYYLADTTGWGPTVAGRPTAVWVRHPSFSQWANAFGLPAKYPNASGEQDDADQDGLTNNQEMVAGTDPTERTSALVFEALARPGDLSEDDKGAINPNEFAFYFQSVPGRSYEIQARDALDSAWRTAASVTATTTQKRVRLTKPSTQRFYRVVIPGVTAGMALIPGGSFTMGDTLNEGAADELPTHPVTLSAFYADKYEVTKALWDEVKTWAIGHGYSFDNDGAGLGSDYPVESVNWYDVVKWCNARSEKEGRAPAYYTDEEQTKVYRTGQVNVENSWVKWDGGYRLPTEAEWEGAARGGLSGKRFAWGNTITHSDANYFSSPDHPYDGTATWAYHPSFDDDPMPYTGPVGWFPTRANGYGLQDVAGNVAEWCWDWHGAYAEGSVTDPRGPATGSYRVDRGGGWSSTARDCRSAYRNTVPPAFTGNGLGFRSVLSAGQ